MDPSQSGRIISPNQQSRTNRQCICCSNTHPHHLDSPYYQHTHRNLLWILFFLLSPLSFSISLLPPPSPSLNLSLLVVRMEELQVIKRELTLIKTQIDGLLDNLDRMDTQRQDHTGETTNQRERQGCGQVKQQ